MIFKPLLYPRFAYYFRIKDFFYSLIRILRASRSNSIQNLAYFSESQVYDYNFGRTALRVALSSLNPGRSLNIGIQAYNCETVFQSIRRAGHSPVFIDINEEYIIDPSDLKKKEAQIDALILTQTFGKKPSIKVYRGILGKRPIIEDNAHSMFSPANQHEKENAKADLSVYSCGFGKFPSNGNGGFLVCNNLDFQPAIEKENQKLSAPGSGEELKTLFKTLVLSLAHYRPIYGMLTYTLGKRIDRKVDFVGKEDITENRGYSYLIGLLVCNENYYKRIRAKKEERAGYLLNKISPSPPEDWAGHLIHSFTAPNAELIISKLKYLNNEASGHFSKSLIWAAHYGYKPGMCKKTEALLPQIITIPIHAFTTKKHLDKIAIILNTIE